MGKFNSVGKKSKFTKESFAALKKKKIETARYKKHKMLKNYEKLCKVEGIDYSSRVNLHKEEASSAGADKEPNPVRKPKKVVVKKQPFAREMQLAAERKAETESRQQAAQQREGAIDSLRRDREKKTELYRRRARQGNRGLGFTSKDLLAKIVQPKI